MKAIQKSTGGLVVQLVRTPDLHSGGRGFKSPPVHKTELNNGFFTSTNLLPFTSNEAWINFGIWLMKTHKPKTAKDLLRYAKRFSYVLENPNMASQLQLLNKDVRRIAMASLSNLSKYCGVYE